MYIQGVSTRKVSAILEQMCGFEVTSMDEEQINTLIIAQENLLNPLMRMFFRIAIS